MRAPATRAPAPRAPLSNEPPAPRQNTQSSEETFKWFGKMKSVMRPMTQGRFNFTVLRVAERHNQRTVWQHRLKVERRRVAEIQKKSHPRE